MNILDIVDANLAKQAETERKERLKTQRKGFFWPSECSVLYRPVPAEPSIVNAIGSCRRKVYWRWTGEPRTNPTQPGSIRVMTMGKAIEQQELDWYFEFGLGIARNFKFQDPKIRISGEGDALVYDPNAGIVGVEVKSFYGYQANKEIMGTKSDPGFPRLDNLLQCMYYLQVTKIPQWRIIYITREYFDHRQFAIGLDGHGFPIVEDRDIGFSTTFKGFSIHDSIQRMDALYELIGKKQLPPREHFEAYPADQIELRYKHGLVAKTRYEKWRKNAEAAPIGDWQCNPKYCNWYDKCQESEEQAQKTA